MRIDNYLSDLGLIKRRTVAKEMADGGHIKINDQRAKPAHNVKVGDIIEITGKARIKVRVTGIPTGKSVPKPERMNYYEILLKDDHSSEFDL
jgi:ribosomal 50S subunit-recycling heat shock protein